MGHPVTPNDFLGLMRGHPAASWLLDRPVKPGDDNIGMQALKTAY
jgi:hypothetical protein